MLVVVSIAGRSPQNMETTLERNFTSVSILLRFLLHGENGGKPAPRIFERSVEQMPRDDTTVPAALWHGGPYEFVVSVCTFGSR